MLKNKSKSISLSAVSYIGDEPVMSLNSTIPSTTGVGLSNESVMNVELYNANKALVRRDMAEFQEMVFSEEDAMIIEVPLEAEPQV